MSLRTKLTLALLGMSFAAIGVVGVTARSVMLNRFDAFVVDRAVEGFVREAVAYHRTYGSWEAAAASESFFDFTRRTGMDRGPGRPAAGRARRPVADRPPDGPGRRFSMGGEPPPFVVTDRAGRVLLALAAAEVGDRVPVDRLALARPMLDGTEELGLAVPMQRPVLTEIEQRYLAAMQTSWLYALLLASGLAIPLGLVLGDRLTRSLRDITTAMDEMSEGRLQQSVTVRSRDEVGRLGDSFNEMSRQLSSAYAELEASRARLDLHAKELAELSRHDALTDLLNRRGFGERSDVLLSQARRYDHDLCVAMIDVDRFKSINDDHSHAVGDQVLVGAAGILRNELRESDVVARYGGEEFVVAFPETSLEDAEALAQRLRMAFETHDWADLLPGRAVTVSIGLAAVDPREGIAPALDRADQRLYSAKEGGRNRVEV